MGTKGTRQRRIDDTERWDSEYQRILGSENDRKKKVHGQGDSQEDAQAGGEVSGDSTQPPPQTEEAD
jgi:hypothetical protein